jgi:O-acetyl-ADP-ribose deacetylase (regulator of RNase III)
VIHTVGPIWQGGSANEPTILANAYRNSLELADSLGCATVAFPSISTGAYGYPLDLAAPIALGTIRETLPRMTWTEEVRFVLFDAQTLAAYQAAY